VIIKTIRFWSAQHNATLIVDVRRQPNGRYALETFKDNSNPLGPDLLESVKDMTKRDALAQVKRWERAYC
jgi:hypothetical protein